MDVFESIFEICKEVDESQRVADCLRNQLSFMEGVVQSEFRVMNEKLTGAEYREQLNHEEAKSNAKKDYLNLQQISDENMNDTSMIMTRALLSVSWAPQ